MKVSDNNVLLFIGCQIDLELIPTRNGFDGFVMRSGFFTLA